MLLPSISNRFVCACLKYESHRMMKNICVCIQFLAIFFLFSFIRLELLLLLYYSWVVRSSFGRCRVKSLYDTSCGKWILKCASFNLKVCQLNRTEAEKKGKKNFFQRRYAKKWPVNSTLCEKQMEIHMETNPKREHTHTQKEDEEKKGKMMPIYFKNIHFIRRTVRFLVKRLARHNL